MTEQTPSHETNTPKVSEKRRRLLAGLSASPILMSLSSRPVLGAQNCAPSGFMSGNLSDPDAVGSCGGKSPGYWKTHLNWPSPFVAGTCVIGSNGQYSCNSGVNSDGTLMSSVFANPNFANRTLLQVLWEQPGALEFHIIAALLNAASGFPNYALTVAEVQNIYNQWRQLGYYTTSNGIKMYAPDIRRFIENTYH